MCSTQYTLLWTLNSTAGKNFELLWILLLRCDWPVQKTLHNQSWSLVQERSGWAPVTTIFLLSSCSAQILHKSTARLQTTESTMGCSDVLRAALPVHHCSGQLQYCCVTSHSGIHLRLSVDKLDDGVDLRQLVSPEQQGQGGDLFVRVVLLPVHVGVVAVAQTHRGPDFLSGGARVVITWWPFDSEWPEYNIWQPIISS